MIDPIQGVFPRNPKLGAALLDLALDVKRDFGASGSSQSTTGSISAGSTTLALASAIDFQNGQGISIANAGPLPPAALPNPTAPTLSQAAGTSSFTANQVVYVGITYTDMAGNQTLAAVASITVSAAGNTISLTESIPFGGTGLGVYVGTTSTPLLLGTVTLAGGITYSGGATSGLAVSVSGTTITVAISAAATSTGASAPTSNTTSTTPTAPTVTAEGTTGTTSWGYAIALLDGKGGMTAASPATTITNGNATLSATNYNAINWPTVSAAGIALYRSPAGGTPSSTGLIAIVNGAAIDDTGLATITAPVGVASTPPSSALGEFLVTTIQSGAGTTSLTLAAAASATVNGAVVRHDDTAAIQSGVNAAAGVAALRVPNGTYTISSTITIPSNSHIIIDGNLRLADQANASMFLFAANASNVTVEGSGVLDGNSANQVGNTWLGIGTNTAASYLIVRGLTFQNFAGAPVSIGGTSHDVLLQGCLFLNNREPAEFAGQSYRCVANGLVIDGSGDAGFAFWGGVYESAITGCAITNCSGGGIGIFNDSQGTQPCHDILVSGCLIAYNQSVGIGILSNQTPAVANYNITLTGNHLYRNNQGNHLSTGSIIIPSGQGSNITIAGNTIHHDGNGSNGAVGIIAQGAKINIIANTIFDEGQGGQGSGIAVSAANSIVIGNLLFDDQTTPTTLYHINVTTATSGLLIANNHVDKNVVTNGAPIAYPGNATAVVDNVGYNPVGLVTAPAVPASGTAVTNTFGFPVRVFVSGGTVTNIAVNGTNTGMTSGMIYLAPNESITLTYTAAPTWTWVGL